MQGASQISGAFCWPVVMAVACCLIGCSQSVSVGDKSLANPAVGSTTSAGSTTETPSSSGTTTPTTGTATALSVQGTPATSVAAGTAYAFQPSVSGTTGTVTFTIANLPTWASFDPSTGALTGTPAVADEGTTSNITITANDTTGAATIGPFDITVTAPAGSSGAPGTATLSWVAPTLNTNGTKLTDLAGYHIYYGTIATQLNQEIILNSGSVTTYVINGLTAGTYYFAISAVSSEGTESVLSNIASKTI